MNQFCNDVDGRILSIGDKVVVLDCEDLDNDLIRRGDLLTVKELVDAESNYIYFKDNHGDYGFFGHRVLKLNLNQ